jgi:hypothetical protein
MRSPAGTLMAVSVAWCFALMGVARPTFPVHPFHPHRRYPGKAEVKIVGRWNSQPRRRRPGRAYAANGDHPGCILRPATLAGHAGQGKTSPRDHTRHPSPETAKHQCCYGNRNCNQSGSCGVPGAGDAAPGRNIMPETRAIRAAGRTDPGYGTRDGQLVNRRGLFARKQHTQRTSPPARRSVAPAGTVPVHHVSQATQT